MPNSKRHIAVWCLVIYPVIHGVLMCLFGISALYCSESVYCPLIIKWMVNCGYIVVVLTSKWVEPIIHILQRGNNFQYWSFLLFFAPFLYGFVLWLILDRSRVKLRLGCLIGILIIFLFLFFKEYVGLPFLR